MTRRPPLCRRCILLGLLLSGLLHGAAGMLWLSPRTAAPPPPETRVVQLDLVMFASGSTGDGDDTQQAPEEPIIAPQPPDEPLTQVQPMDEPEPAPEPPVVLSEPLAPEPPENIPEPPAPEPELTPIEAPPPATQAPLALAQAELPPVVPVPLKPTQEPPKAVKAPVKQPAKTPVKQATKKTVKKPVEKRVKKHSKPRPPQKSPPKSASKAAPSPKTTQRSRSGNSGSRSGKSEGATANSAAGKASAERAYLAELQRAIGRHQRFPDAARRARKTGVATISFEVKADGRVRKIRLAKSSGDSTLDKAALDALHRLNRFKPIPAVIGRKNWMMRVPIRFDLR